jgi:trypsin-like peptidase
MTSALLPPLPGIAPPGTWKMGTADRVEADGRLATFAVVMRPTPTSLRLLGTGFYLQPKGGFVTAAHVALEAQKLMSERSGAVGIAHTLPDGRTLFRPIWKFYIHPTADVAFGVPRVDIVNDWTGEACRAKVLCLKRVAPDYGTAVSTWAYPLHRVLGDETTGQVLQLEPNFYNGVLQELYVERGPSAKLIPPYYRTNIHLHGGSSGGPVFNFDGEVFGIASCSYEGAEDIAFVTPASALLEIEVPETIGAGEADARMIPLRDIAARGLISVR